MREYVQKSKDYYDAMNAKYSAYTTFVKLLALIAGIAFSGWTAVAQISAPEIDNIKSNIKSTVGEIKTTKKAVRHTKAREYSVQSPAPVVVTSRKSFIDKILGASGWILLVLLLGYLLFSHLLSDYRKWRGKNVVSSTLPKVL